VAPSLHGGSWIGYDGYELVSRRVLFGCGLQVTRAARGGHVTRLVRSPRRTSKFQFQRHFLATNTNINTCKMGKSGKPNKERSGAAPRGGGGGGRGRGRGGGRGRGAPRGRVTRSGTREVPVIVQGELTLRKGANGRRRRR
jgi:hypothetical protein